MSSNILFTDDNVADFVDEHLPAFHATTAHTNHDGSVTLRSIDGRVLHVAAGAWLVAASHG